MGEPIDSWNSSQTETLKYVWSEYRVWAATARQQKAKIFRWRFIVLIFTVIGALFGTISSELNTISSTPGTINSEMISGSLASISWLTPPHIFGWLSGVAIVLATYFSKEILKPEYEQSWVRARSIAEALKSESFLFRSGVSPYDTPESGKKLFERVSELESLIEDIQPLTLSEDQKRSGLPQGPLSVSDYIKNRVDDQIYHFYQPKAEKYERIMKFWRGVNLVLGALAAILGAFLFTGWIALLTTIATLVAAYLYAQHYQHLITSYKATARQLEFLKAQCMTIGVMTISVPRHEKEKYNQFISNCEGVISIENKAWMARLVKQGV